MKSARVAIVALCLALLVLPSALIPLFGHEDGGAENRVLADYPTLVDEDEGLNDQFAGDFEAWLCDHFAFRDAIVRANAWLNYRLLRSSANEQVVVGKGDWLYFEPTVPDYTGEGRLTDQELEAIAANLRAFSEAYERVGARVFLAIVPNKSTIYPQYMPERYAMRGDDGNLPLLREACADLPLTWIDLAEPFREAAAGDRLIYLKTDTHWNALGAAIAAHTVLEAMGRPTTDYAVGADIPFRDGDLARLLGLPGLLCEAVPEVTPERPLPEGDFSRIELTARGGGEGRLTVFRDSFGTAIGPWLADAYEQSEMIWQYPLEGGHDADDVLVLICERNLREYFLPEPVLSDDMDADEPEELAGSGFDDEEEALLAPGGDGGFFDDVDDEDETDEDEDEAKELTPGGDGGFFDDIDDEEETDENGTDDDGDDEELIPGEDGGFFDDIDEEETDDDGDDEALTPGEDGGFFDDVDDEEETDEDEDDEELTPGEDGDFFDDIEEDDTDEDEYEDGDDATAMRRVNDGI